MALRRVFLLVPILLLTLAGCFRQASDPVDPVNETRLDTPAIETPLLDDPIGEEDDIDLPSDDDSTPTIEVIVSTPLIPVTIDSPANPDDNDEDEADDDTAPGGLDVIPMFTATPSGQSVVITPGAPSGPSAISTPVPAQTVESTLPTADVLVTPTDMFFIDTANINPECIHLVRSGDTLFRIALNNNTTLEAIRQANPDITGDIIQPGDEIILPNCDTSTPVPGVEASPVGDGGIVSPIDTDPGSSPGTTNQGIETTHTVRSGETLGAIATRYGVTINAIVQRNSLANPNVLSVGQQLIIPAPAP